MPSRSTARPRTSRPVGPSRPVVRSRPWGPLRVAPAVLVLAAAVLAAGCGPATGTALPVAAEPSLSAEPAAPSTGPASGPAEAAVAPAGATGDATVDADAAVTDPPPGSTASATRRPGTRRTTPATAPRTPARPTSATAPTRRATAPAPARPTTATVPVATRTTRASLPPTRTTTSAPATSASPVPAGGQTVRSAKKGAAIWAFDGIDRAFADSGASWYYTWSTSGLAGVRQGEFVPMIWGPKSVTPTALAQAKAAGGTLLGFNEPDLAGQANMSVEQALALWPQLQSTGLRLASPVVASGGATAGGWLDRFMSGAAARGYRVDVIALHWYGGDFSSPAATAQLREYLTAVHDRYHKPVWLTEYALMRFGPTRTPSAAEQATFVTSSTAMLEGLPFVERYAWFSFPTPTEGGLGTGLYSPGGTATAMGAAYRRAGPR